MPTKAVKKSPKKSSSKMRKGKAIVSVKPLDESLSLNFTKPVFVYK